MTNGAKTSAPTLAFKAPNGDVIKYLNEQIDDSTQLYSIKTLNKFNWGVIDVRFGAGLLDGSNNEGHVFLANAFIDTPLRALKIYGGVEHQYFENGRNEKHLKYGIGFWAPILNGQLLTGYLAKRRTDIVFVGQQLIDGDNGYVLGLKTDYIINDNWSYQFLGEYSWNKEFTDVNKFQSPPLPPQLGEFPIYALGEANLTETSYKMTNKINYHISDNFKIGVEYIRMKGDAILIQNAGLAGVIAEYSF